MSPEPMETTVNYTATGRMSGHISPIDGLVYKSAFIEKVFLVNRELNLPVCN